MQPTLVRQQDYSHWIINESYLSSIYDFEVIALPTKKELQDFLCDVVPQIRILHFKVGEYSNVPEWQKEFTLLITECALQLRPWQFKWLSQDSGQIEFSWVEGNQARSEYTGDMYNGLL